MKALLLGAGGLLGRALAASVPAEVRLAARDRAALDVADPAGMAEAIRTERPNVVVNAAAYTAVDGAEREPGLAYAVNATAVAALGQLAAAAGARVIHIGTDYVFDGAGGAPYAEDAAPAPLNTYGRSKLEGERALLASGADALVVRTQWLYGDDAATFPHRMLTRAREGLATRVVADQHGRPTAADDLAPVLWRLAGADLTGILHVAGGGEATWYEIARAVFHHAGRPDLVTPCGTADFPTPARRPADARLDTARADRLLGPLPDWRRSLQAWLDRPQRPDRPHALPPSRPT